MKVIHILFFDSFYVYRKDVIVNANGTIVRCPGLFQGEAIVMLEANSRSILFVMMALKPSIEFFQTIFYHLCQQSFLQCILYYLRKTRGYKKLFSLFE